MRFYSLFLLLVWSRLTFGDLYIVLVKWEPRYANRPYMTYLPGNVKSEFEKKYADYVLATRPGVKKDTIYIEAPKTVIAEIKREELVLSVDKDRPIQPESSDDSDTEADWARIRITKRERPDNYEQYRAPIPPGGRYHVYVYVVDIGVANHREFFHEYRDMQIRAIPYGYKEPIDNYHGTEVASVIAGETLGVAPNAILIPCRVTEYTLQGVEDVLHSISQNVAYRHSNGTHILDHVIINYSMGQEFGNISSLTSHFRDLLNLGVHCVMSAGNHPNDACANAPWMYGTAAIKVGSTDKDDYIISRFAYGRCVDLFAPGYKVKVADAEEGYYEYKSQSGTSLSAPLVTGTIARILSKSKTPISPTGMKEHLIKISTKNVLRVKRGFKFSGSPNRLLFLED